MKPAALTLLSAAAMLFVFPATLFATEIHVPTDQATIQAGIDAAVQGDVVLVAPGFYQENIDFKGKTITVKSIDGPEVTFIDGDNPSDPDRASVVYFQSMETTESRLEGFTILDGQGTLVGMGYDRYGGGIYCENASPTLVGNIIAWNTASIGGGGGIYSFGGSPIIENNKIIKNFTDSMGDCGGGIYCSGGSPVIEQNLISENSSSQKGGGIFCMNGNGIIRNNIIARNHSYQGGGIFALNNVTMINNIVTANVAGMGAGIYCSNCTVTCLNNTLVGNRTGHGGGQQGGGIYCLEGVLTLKNSILWNNRAPYGPEIAASSSDMEIEYCDLRGGQNSLDLSQSTVDWGNDMIDSDPDFVDPDDGDFHLTGLSPCVNSGDNGVAGLPGLDMEGDPRIAQDVVDMGADEFHTHLYVTGDLSPAGLIQFKFIGWPGASPVGLILGAGVLDDPIPSSLGDWYLDFPIQLLKIWNAIPGNGILLFPAKMPAFPHDPYYLQAVIGEELSNLCVVQADG